MIHNLQAFSLASQKHIYIFVVLRGVKGLWLKSITKKYIDFYKND